MNRRVLKRFAGPEIAPHPRLVRLLQDSISAVKQVHASGGKPPVDGLLTRISESYKEIMAATEAVEPKPPAPAAKKVVQNYATVVSGLGGTVHSLEELSQRLGRMLAVLRQGGEMSREEIARRLGDAGKPALRAGGTTRFISRPVDPDQAAIGWNHSSAGRNRGTARAGWTLAGGV